LQLHLTKCPHPISLPAHDNAPKEEDTAAERGISPYDSDPLLVQEGKREAQTKDLAEKTTQKK